MEWVGTPESSSEWWYKEKKTCIGSQLFMLQIKTFLVEKLPFIALRNFKYNEDNLVPWAVLEIMSRAEWKM